MIWQIIMNLHQVLLKETFEILKKDFSASRDGLIISKKAGYLMWQRTYEGLRLKKFLVTKLDLSL